MPPSDRAMSGGAPPPESASEQQHGSGLLPVELAPAGRRREATIEGLTVALGKMRRGAAALRAENHELRLEIAELRTRDHGRRGHEPPRRDFRMLIEIAIPADRKAPGAARIVLAGCVGALVAPVVLEDAQLLLSELVTNSLVHGQLDEDDSVLVRVSLAPKALRLEVENPGVAGVVASSGSDTQAGRGFGLELVELLGGRWGVQRDASTRVWVEIPRRQAGDR